MFLLWFISRYQLVFVWGRQRNGKHAIAYGKTQRGEETRKRWRKEQRFKWEKIKEEENKIGIFPIESFKYQMMCFILNIV